jgi:sirohydrochlorin cobaltochelatase
VLINIVPHHSKQQPAPSSSGTAVVVIGHGSRDARGNAEFESLVALYREANPSVDVSHGYIEIASPSIKDALAAAAVEHSIVIVLPLFLFAAGHLKNDIPLAIAETRTRFPHVRFESARELGVHSALINLAFARAEASMPLPDGAAIKTAVIVVGRGASDPDANGEFCKLTRLFGEGRGLAWVLPSFIGITRPSFEEVAELVVRSRPERVIVVPYFLFAGRLLTKLQEQAAGFSTRYPWITFAVADSLGADERILAVMHERVRAAIDGSQPLPCELCQYRTPIAGITENVGGLQSLLWSVRHSFTHTQAVPHVHAHRRLRKHVLVCANVDCAGRGSIALITALRRSLVKIGLERDIRVTRTGCMGRCGEGPTVAVYPDGIWYRGVQDTDAEEIVSEHLVNERLVPYLVDDIMQ